MKTPTLNLLVLRSPDIDRAAHFYAALGLHFTRHAHGKGPEHYSAELDGLIFELYPQSEKEGPTTSARIGFKVESVDETAEALLKAGAQLLSKPHDSEWGRRAVLKDPDGHKIELTATQ